MNLRYETTLSVDEQKKRLETLASDLVTDYLAVWRWRPDGALEVKFDEPSKAAGIEGVATPGPGAVSLELDLPLRFRLFGSRIEDGIRAKLAEAFKAPGSGPSPSPLRPLVVRWAGGAALLGLGYALWRVLKK